MKLIKKFKFLIIYVLILISGVFLLLFWIHIPPAVLIPDNQIASQYLKHEQEFDNLTKQLKQDKDISTITKTSASDFGGHDIKNGEIVYINLMKKLSIVRISKTDCNGIYFYYKFTWFNGDKGIAYLPCIPENIVDNLDTSNNWPKDNDMSVDTYHKQIKEDWYLFRTPFGD